MEINTKENGKIINIMVRELLSGSTDLMEVWVHGMGYGKMVNGSQEKNMPKKVAERFVLASSTTRHSSLGRIDRNFFRNFCS